MRFFAITFLVLLLATGVAYGMTIEEIMEKVDQNSYYTEAYAHMEMTIKAGRREMVKEMISWSKGENSLVEFTNRADRGTKYLKLKDELWMFFPDAEDLVLISGHMLKQGFMGSDVSYEDMLQNEKMTELYDFELEGTEEHDGRQSYVIKATAKEGKEVSYAIRKIWVDTESFVAIKEELYALNGRLLKVNYVQEFKEIDGRNFPTVFVMEDRLRKDTSTTVRVLEIDFSREVSDDLFTLQGLTR